MKKKNILIALPNDTLGGAEQVLKMIATYLLEKGCCVHVFFLKRRNTSAWEEIGGEGLILHYTSARTERLGVLHLLYNLYINRHLNFQMAFTSHVHLNGFIGLLRKLRLIRLSFFVGRESTVIFNRYKGLKRLYFKLFYLLGYSSIDLLICQTNGMKKSLLTVLPFLEKKIRVEVIPNPINIDSINSLANSSSIELNIYGRFIVAAGRLIPEKGFDILIEAFASVKKTYPALNLVILGEGPSRKELEAIILQQSLEKCVFMIGFVNNVYPYFKAAEVCVVSSRVEGFPNVLLQMMSQNLKVVSTDCADGVNEISGITMADRNSRSLETAICQAISGNTERNRKMFDEQLEKRSIDSFINTISNNLNN